MDSVIRYLICSWYLIVSLQPSISKEAIIKDDVMKKWLRGTYAIINNGEWWSGILSDDPSYSKTCGTGQNADFWFISVHVNLTETFANLMYVDVEAELTLCGDVTKRPCYSNRNYFEVYVYRRQDSPVIPYSQNDRTATRKFLLDRFSFVYNITNKTSPTDLALNRTQNETFTFLQNKSKGVTFGIRSRGACGKIYRMKMYYYYCEERFINSIKFENTISPVNGSKQVLGNCSLNSLPSNNGRNLYGYCHSNGSWSINDQIKCLCIAGHEPNKKLGCSPCPTDHFKPNISNSNCTKCPSNANSNNNKTSCECKDGYYKFQNSSILSCYGLLQLFGKPTVSYGDGVGNITIRWNEASSSNSLQEQILYDVECYSCDKSQCNGSCVGEDYDPGQFNLTQTSVVVSNLSSGNYTFRIYPKNSLNNVVGKEKWNFSKTDPVNVIVTARPTKSTTKKPEKTTKAATKFKTLHFIIIGVVGFVLLIVILLLVIFLLRRRRKEKKAPTGGFPNAGVELPSVRHRDYVDPTIYDSPEDAVCEFAKELEPSVLSFEMLIGGGEFGDVYKGKMTKPDKSKIPVAVKTLKHDTTLKSEKDFLLEASAMGQFDDPNVVRLEGVVTKSKPRMIVIEFMANGSLENFLKSGEGKLTQLQLIGMAKGVASGMKYLAGIKFVHRDLAARNILVNDRLLCKVSDFGLSRELEGTDSSRGEYSTSGGKIPVRWTAPEAIKYRKFSTASDVWSYGILLWEIMSFGERPYWDWGNFKVLEELDQGYRLPPPLNCPKGVHMLMLQCWKVTRQERPSFSEIDLIVDNWIRSPETMDDELDFSLSLSKWLESIKMGNYSSKFTNAGYRKVSQILDLKDEDLKLLGITLVGHRHKILKNIGCLPMRTRSTSLEI